MHAFLTPFSVNAVHDAARFPNLYTIHSDPARSFQIYVQFIFDSAIYGDGKSTGYPRCKMTR